MTVDLIARGLATGGILLILGACLAALRDELTLQSRPRDPYSIRAIITFVAVSLLAITWGP